MGNGPGWGGESLKSARQEAGLQRALQPLIVTVSPNRLLLPDFSELILKIIQVKDFPGGPVVKMHFQCRGHGFDPW